MLVRGYGLSASTTPAKINLECLPDEAMPRDFLTSLIF